VQDSTAGSATIRIPSRHSLGVCGRSMRCGHLCRRQRLRRMLMQRDCQNVAMAGESRSSGSVIAHAFHGSRSAIKKISGISKCSLPGQLACFDATSGTRNFMAEVVLADVFLTCPLMPRGMSGGTPWDMEFQKIPAPLPVFSFPLLKRRGGYGIFMPPAFVDSPVPGPPQGFSSRRHWNH
jgi:hypothetical protein